MDTQATTLLAKLFGNDGRTIPYRPEVAKVVVPRRERMVVVPSTCNRLTWPVNPSAVFSDAMVEPLKLLVSVFHRSETQTSRAGRFRNFAMLPSWKNVPPFPLKSLGLPVIPLRDV